MSMPTGVPSVPINQQRSALNRSEIEEQVAQLNPRWEVIEQQKLRRVFSFADFQAALEFVMRVARVADQADHHPDIHILYNKVILESWTHSLSGLSPKDFALAKQINAL